MLINIMPVVQKINLHTLCIFNGRKTSANWENFLWSGEYVNRYCPLDSRDRLVDINEVAFSTPYTYTQIKQPLIGRN